MAAASLFLQDLQRYGPEYEPSEPLSLEAARHYCARLATSHYENFSVVTALTPKELRPHFASVYAFCRWSDDLGDEVGDPERSKQLLHWWRGQLDDLYQGRATHPVMIALQETVREFAIPIDPFAALISAFEQDQVVTRYETREQLLDYCKRSADPDGHLVLYLGRAFNAENAWLSDLTCTGLQLANFWQDVARDFAIGRIYLPLDDIHRFGYSESELKSLRFNAAFRSLLEEEVAFARDLLERGRELIPRLPKKLALSVDLFNRGGLAILRRIVAEDYNVLASRPKLSKFDKASLIGGALVASLARRIRRV